MAGFPSRLSGRGSRRSPRDATRIVIGLRSPAQRREVEGWLASAGLALEDAGDAPDSPDAINQSPTCYWARSGQRRAIPRAGLERLRTAIGEQLAWLGPVYRCGRRGRHDLMTTLPHALLIRMRSSKPASFTDLLAAHGLREAADLSRYQAGGFQYCLVGDPLGRPSWELRAALLQDSRVLDCRHEHMPMVVPTQSLSNDPLLPKQWHLARIAAMGEARSGWDISRGDPSVVIGILDSGCQLEHPDLIFAGEGVTLDTMQAPGGPRPPGETNEKTRAHGTLAAGVAAASIDNGSGVAGVAGRCRVLPAAFVSWTDAELARGITFLATQGARVVSMSIGQQPGEGDPVWQPAVVDPAIDQATARGCLLVAAAGNTNIESVMYPARNPKVMAVGASDDVDRRCDVPGGQQWGSDFGPELSVVAPGFHIVCTDLRGTEGRNKDGKDGEAGGVHYPTAGDPEGHYFFEYGGTSGATPQVAAVAAAIWSLRPELSASTVRALIERNADKVGGYAYATKPGHPNGTWHKMMGYGRLNMLRALEAAEALPRRRRGRRSPTP